MSTTSRPTWDEVVTDGERAVCAVIVAIFALCIFVVLVWHYGNWTDEVRARDLERVSTTTTVR